MAVVPLYGLWQWLGPTITGPASAYAPNMSSKSLFVLITGVSIALASLAEKYLTNLSRMLRIPAHTLFGGLATLLGAYAYFGGPNLGTNMNKVKIFAIGALGTVFARFALEGLYLLLGDMDGILEDEGDFGDLL